MDVLGCVLGVAKNFRKFFTLKIFASEKTGKLQTIKTIASKAAINTERIDDLRDEYFKRWRITFNNGYLIDIAIGSLTHGDAEGMFDIAAINQNGDLDNSLLDALDAGNNGIVGFCYADKLIHYLEKIGGLPE